MLEFGTGIFGCDLPIGFGVMEIAIMLPGGDFLGEGLLIGDTSVEALRRKNSEFGLGQIEPAAVFGRVVPLETLDEAPCPGSRLEELVFKARYVSKDGIENDLGIARSIVDDLLIMEVESINRFIVGRLEETA